MKEDETNLRLTAERVLRRRNGNVVVRMFGPEEINRDDPAWCCRIEITGLPDLQPRDVFGTDGFEAVRHALTVIAKELEPYRDELAWGDGPIGGVGFGHHITDAYGSDIYRHLDKMVEEETTRCLQRKKSPSE